MELAYLKELLKLLRKEGVSEFKAPALGVEIKLAEQAPESPYRRKKAQEAPTDESLQTIDEILAGAGGPPLTPEEALFYSSTPPLASSDEDTDTPKD